jgi:RNA polymerase sigma-70 factor (ECF subfamily)
LDLLEEARAGSREAIGQLIERWRPYLMKIAHNEGDAHTRSKHGASDVVQDACAKAFQVFRTFQGGTSKDMRAWLRTILLHCLRDVRGHFDAAKRRALAEISLQDVDDSDGRNDALADDIGSPSEHAARSEERQIVEAALRGLSDLDRKIIELRQKDGRAFAEIARQLDLTEDAVQKRWARAIHTLQVKARRLGGAADE